MGRLLYDRWTVQTPLNSDQVAGKIAGLFQRKVTPETLRGKRGFVRIREISCDGHVAGVRRYGSDTTLSLDA